MRNLFRYALLGLASTSLLNCADVDDDTALIPDETQVDRDDGRPLTPPSSDAPEKIARSYLLGRVGDATDQLKMVSESRARGVTHVRFEQFVDGLRIHGAFAKAAVSPRGELLQVMHKIAPTTRPLPTAVVESDALRTVLVEYGYGVEPARLRSASNVTTFAATAEMYREPTVERVAYVDGRALRVGFLIETWSRIGNQLDHTLVGGDGKIVWAERRTNNDSYRVYEEDPSKGAAVVVDGTGKGWLGAASHTSHNISGPNVRAYLDTDNNNAADSAATTGATAVTDGNFLATGDLEATPKTAANRAVAVQTLFYLNNVLHDRLEAAGFDNGAGNFEGNDPVNAEAQDGGGVDNANFATPSDGSSPRMQMYLWTGSAPDSYVDLGGTPAELYGAYKSSFGPAFTTNRFPLAAANVVDGCTAISSASVSGKTAIIDRGNCDFTVKVRNAQSAGAKAVVIVNNIPQGGAFAPGGTDRKVSIPSVMVSFEDGATLRSRLGVSAGLRASNLVALQVDGDLDADIVFHEYGHGLTWRMIGSMSGTFAGAIGEGAGDTLAFLNNGDDRIGEYAYSNPLGIRREPYGAYSLTYRNWTSGEVHNDGEIYAAAMWKVLENYQAQGLTATDLLADFVDGMNYTQPAPRPEHMRDGMIASLGAGAGPSNPRFCAIWRGFANRGIGVGATVSGKGRLTITESFAVPSGCAAP